MIFIDAHSLNISHHLEAAAHSAKHSVLVVEPRTGDCRHVELRRVGVLPAIGHCQSARFSMAQPGYKLILELSTPYALSTTAVALRAPRLNHEASYHSMEQSVVVITIFGVSCKVLHC